jgi:hypothetical protein
MDLPERGFPFKNSGVTYGGLDQVGGSDFLTPEGAPLPHVDLFFLGGFGVSNINLPN